MDTLKSIGSSIISVPGQILDTAAWFSPPILILMFINMILLIVVIAKLVSWMTEGFANPGEEVTMYYLPWCGACQKDIDNFNTLSLKYGKGVSFRMHDLGTNPVTGITSAPTYLFKKADGSVISKIGSYGSLAAMEVDVRKAFDIDAYDAAQASLAAAATAKAAAAVANTAAAAATSGGEIGSVVPITATVTQSV